jgi:formylglycine-generating enzyme required for sulfatase activity
MIKRGMIIFSMTFVFFLSIFEGNQEKVFKQNNNGLGNERANVLPDIIDIKKKAKKVYSNDKGFIEAEFRYGIVMVYIPEGKFIMGTTKGEEKELPLHCVYLDGYWIGKYPVTVAQFRVFIQETNYITDSEKGEGSWIEEGGKIRYDVSWDKPNFKQEDNHPVICISWNDANAYIKWLSQKIGIDFCLPTEAQWEKAARGTDQRTYPWGNQIPDGSLANFADSNYRIRFGRERRNSDPRVNDGYAQTSPVNAYPKGQSPYGIFDMAGNTIDWLYDWYDPEYYSNSPLRNPTGPSKKMNRKKYKIPGGWSNNLQRCIRGGAWTDASGELSLAEGGHSIRSDMREHTDQYSSDDHLGFRLARDYVSREKDQGVHQ